MSRQAEERRQRLRARRKAGLSIEDDWGEGDEVGFPCALLCPDCGFYLDPERSDHPEHCPGCGSSDWVDLSLDSTVSSLREANDLRIGRVMRWSRRVAWVFTLVTFVGSIVGAAATGSWSIGLSFFVMGLVGVGITHSDSIMMRLIDPPGSAKSIRWSLPKWEPGRTQELGVSNVESDDRCIAPFSGDKVVGYICGVKLERPVGGREQWIVVETRNVPFRVGDHVVGRDDCRIESTMRLVAGPGSLDDPDSDPRAHRLRRFLRERGYEPHEGDFSFYEYRLNDGDEVTVLRNRSFMVIPTDSSGSIDTTFMGRSGPPLLTT